MCRASCLAPDVTPRVVGTPSYCYRVYCRHRSYGYCSHCFYYRAIALGVSRVVIAIFIVTASTLVIDVMFMFLAIVWILDIMLLV